MFPHGNRTGRRRIDLDHPVPYRPGGPPGQTGLHNTAPLGRTGHRAKTHLGYTVRQTEGGDHLWASPHGLHRLVDAHGTHVLDPALAAALASDDPVERALARLEHRLRTGTLTH